jgi:transcriptional regulator with XRE-family HTH domain
MDHTSSNLGANVRSLREERGLTQRQLAEVSGIPRPTLAHIESGEANPTLHVLVKLAAALSNPIERLIASPRAIVRVVARDALAEHGRSGVAVRDLVPEPVPGVAIERVELQPGAQFRAPPRAAGTRQFVACERGAVAVEVGEGRWPLGTGDLLVAGGDVGYRVENPGRGAAVLYAVRVPAPAR